MNGPPPPAQDVSTTGLDPKVAAALAYLAGPLSGVLLLMAERSHRDVRFHAWQSIVGLGGLGVIVALLIVSAFASIVISATLFTILLYTGWIVWAGWIALWIACLLKAYAGQRWKLPLAGDFAERQASRTS